MHKKQQEMQTKNLTPDERARMKAHWLSVGNAHFRESKKKHVDAQVVTKDYNLIRSALEDKVKANPKAKLTKEEKIALGKVYNTSMFNYAIVGNTQSTKTALKKLVERASKIEAKSEEYAAKEKEEHKERTSKRPPSTPVKVHTLRDHDPSLAGAEIGPSRTTANFK